MYRNLVLHKKEATKFHDFIKFWLIFQIIVMSTRLSS